MAKNKHNDKHNHGKINQEADHAKNKHENKHQIDHAKKASNNQHEKFGKHAGKSELGQKEQEQGDWKGNWEKNK